MILFFLENESTLMNLTNLFLTNSFAIQAINKYSLPNIELIDSWNIENIVGFTDNYQLFYDGGTLLFSYNNLSSNGGRQMVVVPITL